MMVMPSRVKLLVISRVPAPMKSSPGGVPVKSDFGPTITFEVVAASFNASRPFSGRSLIERVFSVSDRVASSVEIGGDVASTVTTSVVAPTLRTTSVLTT